MTFPVHTLFFSLIPLVLTILVPPSAAQVQKPTTYSVYVENDVTFGTDQHYTNGLRIERMQLQHRDGRTTPAAYRDAAPFWMYAPVSFVNGVFGLERTIQSRLEEDKYAFASGFAFGQTMHTPVIITTETPSLRDRPYAGYLYYGSRFSANHIKKGHEYSSEFQIGFVGPFSFAEETQRRWHDQIGSKDPKGWDTQIERISFSVLMRHRRYAKGSASPYIQGRLITGNVMTMLGLGSGLQVGYGHRLKDKEGRYRSPIGSIDDAPGIKGIPSDSASVLAPRYGSKEARAKKVGISLFVRAEARYIPYNFLVTGRDGDQVDLRPWGGDGAIGASLRYAWVQISGQLVYRAPEIAHPSPFSNLHRFAAFRLNILPR